MLSVLATMIIIMVIALPPPVTTDRTRKTPRNK